MQRKFVGAGCVRRFLRRTGTPGFQTVWDTTADGESVRIESEPVFRCPDGRHEDRKCWQRVELGIHGRRAEAATGLEKSEKPGVQAARNGPSEDGKCWQRVELGIHGLNK